MGCGSACMCEREDVWRRESVRVCRLLVSCAWEKILGEEMLTVFYR